MQYLILGATGYIGRYIYKKMQNDGIAVVGTARNGSGDPTLSVYDIELDDLRDVICNMDDTEKVAVICTAVSNINQCCEDYEHAYHVNIIKTKEVINELSVNGFHIIWFSSDNVFDGIKGDYTEEDTTSAINCYGKMKEEMERYILSGSYPVCILRISKVVGTRPEKQNVLYEWQMLHEKKETIRCIKNNKLSFVAIEDVYQAVLTAGSKRLKGLYNVVGDRSYTRKELAELFFDLQGITDQQIVEMDVGEFHFRDKRPLDLSMSNRKFCNETGYEFTAMEQVIREYIGKDEEYYHF